MAPSTLFRRSAARLRHFGANFGLLDVAHRVLKLALIDRAQFAERLVLLVDATESSDRVLIGRRELVEDRAVSADRVFSLLEPFLVDLAQARVELHLLVVVFGRDRTLLQHAGKLGPLLERGVNAIEVGEGVRSCGATVST